jgi:hypothetical protein
VATQSSALSHYTSKHTPNSNPKDNVNLKKAAIPAANTEAPENWQYPHAMDAGFATYINHGCVLDRQGYPLYPNGSTMFVRPAGTSITNFGAVGFSKTCSNGARSVTSKWKVVQMYCLGVLLCNQDGCDYAGPHKIDQLLSR